MVPLGVLILPKLKFHIRKHESPGATISSAEIEVTRGTSILDAAFAAGVLLPTQCGGFATCHTCKVRISPLYASAFSPISASEAPLLDDGTMEFGSRLACQTQVLQDAVVEVDPLTLEPGA